MTYDPIDDPSSVKVVEGGLASNGPWPPFDNGLQRDWAEARDEVEPEQALPVNLSPEAHRQEAVERIAAGLASADQRLRLTRQWAMAIGYHRDVVDKLDEMIELVASTDSLIAIHER